jgi:hypothetical protein
MANILDQFDNTVTSRIDDKEAWYSISKEDVGNSIREGVTLAGLFPLLDPDRDYPLNWLGRDSSYNLYISLQDDVSGDTTIGANWQLVSSASGSKQVYDLAADSLSTDVYESANPSITAYSTENIYIVSPDVPNTGTTPTYEINALGALPIQKYSSGNFVDPSVGDFSGTLLLLYRGTYFLIAGGASSSGGSTAYTTEITCDGSQTDYTITHNLGVYDPIFSITLSSDASGNPPFQSQLLPLLFDTANTALLNVGGFNTSGYKYKIRLTK